MMSCSSPALSCYFDGELNETESVALEEHLSTCLSCRRELAQHRQLRGDLESDDIEIPWLSTVENPKRRKPWHRALALVASLTLVFFALDGPLQNTPKPKTTTYKVRVADTKYTITTKGEAELLSIEIGDFQSTFDLEI